MNKSNTFFISPKIPFSLYILIQKLKNDTRLLFNKSELNFISNINQLFDYNNEISDDDKKVIENILIKISSLPNYDNVLDKLQFLNLNTYTEITNYNIIFYKLLQNRNYKQIINPFSVSKLDFSVGISDIGPLPSININKFENLDESEKMNFIIDLINNKKVESKVISQDILSKSIIDSKINTLTRILSNKSILYNILDKEEFIPDSVSFNTNIEKLELEELLDSFKQQAKQNKKLYFVIKPSAGTLSDGLGIFNIDTLTTDFIDTWINNPENNKYAKQIGEPGHTKQLYDTWILSDFIQSFLWKLNGIPNTIKQFGNLGISNKLTFNDTKGRINKFRFWCLWTIIDNKFVSYLYNKGYCEIALEELNTFSKTELDPSNIETFYQNYYNVEEDPDLLEKVIINGASNINEKRIEASAIGTYLDFARVVTGDNYPLGKDAWDNEVIPNMISLTNRIVNKCQRYLSCINKYKLDNKLKQNQKSGCFSYFALDILIDDNNKPWLLEANSRPFIGFEEYWNKYDENNEHAINVTNFIDSILNLTIDKSLPNQNPGFQNPGFQNPEVQNFVITTEFKLNNTSKIYSPLSLGIEGTDTSKIYDNIYKILDKNKYTSFPYPRYLDKHNDYIGFRGMSPISKYLISKISEIGKKQFLKLMRDLFPTDAKAKILNRISTLGFYLGDKVQMTNILKSKIKNWDTIIPYSVTVNKTEQNSGKSDIWNILQNNFIIDTIIAKPAYGQQGKGIIISKNKQDIFNHIMSSEEDSWVISRYLDNPYLIKLNKQGVSGINYNDAFGRKCHLRTYVLVHRNEDKLELYMYKKSLIFCAAKEYNDCEDDNFDYCNLTNLYFGSKYYQDVLNANPGDAYKDLSINTEEAIDKTDYNKLIDRVKTIVKTTIFATRNNLECLNKNNKCFQYIAFDFHLEDTESEPEPWLLEVNATPGLKAPDYQWKDYGGINNYLESILNITLKTPISPENEQLFEYLPHRLSSLNKQEPNILKYIKNFETIDDCVTESKYLELKKLLKSGNIKHRSYLTTKRDMCDALI